MAVTETTTAEEQRVREQVARLLAEAEPTDPIAFRGRQFDLGLAWVHFPEGHGGLGVSPRLQRVVDEALRGKVEMGVAARNVIGLGMAAPTIVTHGTEEQKERLLRPLFTGEEIWCQLFSEPGAGSDVAGLSTRAVRDGDEWVLNGQKVWTTLAHIARWGLLLARTDPDAPKHRGLTYFVLDMQADGVDVRPLYQLTGDAEFNEVYVTDTRIPDSLRLGDEGQGWGVALTTLMNERVAIGGGGGAQRSRPIDEALRVWRERGHSDPALKDQLMALYVESEVNRLTNLRAAQLRAKGTPGPEGSVGKLHFAELNKKVYSFAVDLLGMEGSLYPSGYGFERPGQANLGGRDLPRAFLRARANSIEGGTSEIMRNILGERVLGLPGDVRVDKDRPWSEVPRS